MSDWVRVPMANGGERVDLTRLTDGRVMCCICFEYFEHKDLCVSEDGTLCDVCLDCAPLAWWGDPSD